MLAPASTRISRVILGGARSTQAQRPAGPLETPQLDLTHPSRASLLDSHVITLHHRIVVRGGSDSDFDRYAQSCISSISRIYRQRIPTLLEYEL
jgi:hypothetical protein